MRRESGTSGPYSVERPQDRDTYQDGDRGLTELWRDRPYSDVEQPKADPCPDKDAEEGVSPKRLRWDEIARAAARLAAEEADPPEDDGKEEFARDDELVFGMPLWGKVAPLVDGVTNLMYESDSRDKLVSNFASQGVSNSKWIEYVLLRAEECGFGFRYTKKYWENFLKLMPLCGQLKEPYKRELLKNALDQMGVEDTYPFANQPSDMGFRQKSYGTGMIGGDPQEVYEERLPGRVPTIETKNVENWLRLHAGDVADITKNAWEKIVGKKIVDPKTGRFATSRLQSMLRYAFDMPDSQLAMAIMVALVLRDAMRMASEDDAALTRALEGAGTGLSADQVASGMQGASKKMVVRWLDIAISTMHYVGVLPGADDAEPEGGEPEDDIYVPVRNAMMRNLAGIAVDLVNNLLKDVGRQMSQGGIEERPAAEKGSDGEVESAAKALVQAVRKAVDEIDRSDETGSVPDSSGVKSATQDLRAAMERGDIAAAAAAARAAVEALSSMGAARGDPGFDEAYEAAGRLARFSGRAASSTVAELVKRVLSPARSRVVDQSEAEEGIELEDGQELVLPSRYHSVSQALGGATCRFR